MSKSLEELWKPVVGFELDYSEYYEVSNLGRVKSIDREVKYTNSSATRFAKGKILKPGLNSNGYYNISLWKDNRYITRRLHTIVAFAWLEKCPGEYGKEKGKYSIDHIDGVKTNNQATNLRWLSVEEHTKQGLDIASQYLPKGEKHFSSVLTESDIFEIRASDLSYKELASIYNVAPATIVAVLTGHTWKHLKYPNKNEQTSKRKRKLISNFSQEKILDILLDTRPQSVIANDFGVSQISISRIKRDPNRYLKN
jgi:NUMOD4 motif/HNH endonuclease